MIPLEYRDFFLAGAGAAGALIGFLGVAISINPERVFGEGAANRQMIAESAFTALANTFLCSLGSLIPQFHAGILILVLSVASLLQTARSAMSLWRSSSKVASRRASIGLVIASVFLYGYELQIGLQLLSTAHDRRAAASLAGLLLTIFGLGLGRSWELLSRIHVAIESSE